jgi:peptide deformylase
MPDAGAVALRIGQLLRRARSCGTVPVPCLGEETNVIYKVLTYGHAALRQKAKAVEEVTDEIRSLARDMLGTMRDYNGIGLAAEQIGRSEAVCVVDVPPELDGEKDGPRLNPDLEMPLVLVNPEITESQGRRDGQEGCLSFPEIYATVRRAEEITLAYTNLDNERVTLRARGLVARAVQHELDHLDGVLLVDRMSAVKKVAIAGRLKRLRNQARG